MNSDVQRSVCLAMQRFKSRATALIQLRRRAISRYSFQSQLAVTASRNFQHKSFTPQATATYHDDMESEKSAMGQLFHYTSGRWLWDEEQQLQARYKSFNVPQLQTLAAQAIGSKTCDSISKLAEGSFNKVFRLEMNDGRSILARIPNPNAGPAFYTTASEVATIEFVSPLRLVIRGRKRLMFPQGSRCSSNTRPPNTRMECHLSKPGRVGIHLNGRGDRDTVSYRMGRIDPRGKTCYYEGGCCH